MRQASTEEIKRLMLEGKSFVVYLRSEMRSKTVKEMFDVDVVYKELVKSFPSLEFLVVETDEDRDALSLLGTNFTPCVVLVKEGKVHKRLDGIKAWNEYLSFLSELEGEKNA